MCDGHCLTQTGNNNEYERFKPCEHNCVPIKCPNYLVCNNQAPQWVFYCHDNLCMDCNMRFVCWSGCKGILDFKTEECPNCIKEKICVSYPKCDHYTCIDCFKSSYNWEDGEGLECLLCEEKDEETKKYEKDKKEYESLKQLVELIRNCDTDNGLKLIKESTKEIRVCDGSNFWAIMDLLKIEKEELGGRGFYNNRNMLVDALVKGKVFIMTYVESQELFEKRKSLRAHILPNSFNSLYSFCVLDDNDEIDIIWTHKKYRNFGFASAFIDFFYKHKEKHIDVIIPESKIFWKNRGFTWNRITF